MKSDDAGVGDSRAPRKLELEVGAFVLLGVFLAAVAIFVLGEKSHLFKQRVTLHANFPEVQGLKEGAPVRLSGVDVGTVTRVAFARERKRTFVRVDMSLSRDALSRIGADSIARIGAQGLLGDRLLEISLSGGSAKPLHAGDTVSSVPPTDLNRLVEQAGDVLERTRVVAERAADAMDVIANPETSQDLRRSIQSIRHVLEAAERGNGLAHALFFDPKQAQRLAATTDAIHRLAVDSDRGVRRVDALLESMEGESGEVVKDVAGAARSIGETADQLRRSHVVQNLDKASGDVAALTAYARSGQGTLGALVLDPTIYDQLVAVLGGIGRSRILRALVRIAVGRDGDQHLGQHVGQDVGQDVGNHVGQDVGNHVGQHTGKTLEKPSMPRRVQAAAGGD